MRQAHEQNALCRFRRDQRWKLRSIHSSRGRASAIGDPVTAILKKPVKLGSGLVAPKGALVHGRVTHLRQQQNQIGRLGSGINIF